MIVILATPPSPHMGNHFLHQGKATTGRDIKNAERGKKAARAFMPNDPCHSAYKSDLIVTGHTAAFAQ